MCLILAKNHLIVIAASTRGLAGKFRPDRTENNLKKEFRTHPLTGWARMKPAVSGSAPANE